MSYKEITSGNKTAKALAARFIEAGEKKSLAIEVSFEFEEPSTGTKERLAWQGWLTPNAIENTLRTLTEVLEFNGNETHDANGVLTDPNVLNFTKEVQLVVGRETNPNNDKEYPKVKFVNNFSGSSKFQGATPDVLKNKLGAIGFKAAYLAAKQKAPQTSKTNEPPF